MAAFRTTPDRVKGILGRDYDIDAAPDLRPYIRSANVVISRVQVDAAEVGYSLSGDELREMETWLAAHFYTKSDPTYTSRSTSSASGAFVRNPKTPEPYKDGAISIDPSGMLNALLNQQRAGGFWLGKPPSEQIPYDQRN